MKNKIKPIFIGVLIGFIVFPTISLSGTFVSSLIQGKTAEEAVQILAEQMDVLIGRATILEVRMDKEEAYRKEIELKTEARLDKEEAYRKEIELKAEARMNKEKACRKANELKIAPLETKIIYYAKDGTLPIYAKHVPDTTKELLEYLHAYMRNYKETGSWHYLSNPDYTPEFAQKYIPILENRWQEYLVQKELCEK